MILKDFLVILTLWISSQKAQTKVLKIVDLLLLYQAFISMYIWFCLMLSNQQYYCNKLTTLHISISYSVILCLAKTIP
jgi:hypothetical protein